VTTRIVGLEIASTDDFGATGRKAVACATTRIVTAAWSARRTGCSAVAVVASFEAVTATIVGALIAAGLETAFATARCKAALFATEITTGFETTFGTEIATTFETVTTTVAFKTRRAA
jgi:hypothetical protein